MAGLAYIDNDTWRYENAGDADDLILTAPILRNLPATQSKTGTAFYQTTRAKCFDLPATSEVWMKFDVYFNGSQRWRAYNAVSSSDMNGVTAQTSGGFTFFSTDNGTSSDIGFVNVLKTNTLQTVLLHMISGASDGIVEAWVDGNFIYRYTSNVNHGQDFADIYLQSDGSGTFFSNVIISNAPIDLDEDVDVVIAPPTGEILIKLLIFATYIPLPPPDKATADTCRIVQKREKIIGDTSRTVNSIISIDKAIAHTLRKVCSSDKISADTYRFVSKTESAKADSFRQVVKSEKIIADLLRRLREITRADTCRKVNRRERAIARTVIRLPHVLNYVLESRPQTFSSSKGRLLADNHFSLVNTFKDYGVTTIDIMLSEKTLSDDFRFDIASRSMDINETVQGWLLDYPFHFLVEETTQTDLVQSVKGRYNVDDLLYTQLFIATVKIESSGGKTIEIPGGRYEKYRDGTAAYLYPTAEEIITDITHYFYLTPDVRIDDFTPTNLSGDQEVTYADVLSSVFGWTSRLPQRQINVFIRGGILHCIQRGKETAIFDITYLPHSRPTVNKKLIRSLWSRPNSDDSDSNGGKPNPDDSDSPTVDYIYEEWQEPFSGTISFSGKGCSTVLYYNTGLLVRESNYTENAKATMSSNVIYTYEEIFPYDMSEISISLKKAWDKHFYGDFYLSEKKLHSDATVKSDNGYKRTEQFGTTNYRYARTDGDNLYLSSEIDETTTITYELNDNGFWQETDRDTDVRETFHVPLGNGWYGQSVYLNGAAQGSNISQGAPGNKVSQYMIGEVQKTFKGWTITYNKPDGEDGEEGEDDDNDSAGDYDDWRRKLAPIVDTSFPVREFALLNTLTEELLWLNRKVQVTVNLDLIAKVDNGVPSIQHIVDFTERIRFNGEEYFLVSNRISFTPRKLIQKLQLIRWY